MKPPFWGFNWIAFLTLSLSLSPQKGCSKPNVTSWFVSDITVADEEKAHFTKHLAMNGSHRKNLMEKRDFLFFFLFLLFFGFLKKKRSLILLRIKGFFVCFLNVLLYALLGLNNEIYVSDT